MNIFRLAGDLSHLFAVLYLLWKIWSTESCAGISGKTQILYSIVFITRYLDLFTIFISLYNTVLKIVFICATVGTVLLIFVKFRKTYDRTNDSFRVVLLLIPAALLALAVNHDNTVLEVLWTFSIYLESVAILPQLFLINETGEAESITCHYLFLLGSYRLMYLINWVWRYIMESHYDLIAIFAGVIQTLLYVEFFYLYFTKVMRGEKFQTSEASAMKEKLILDRLHHEVCTEFFFDEKTWIEPEKPTIQMSVEYSPDIEQPPPCESNENQLIVNSSDRKTDDPIKKITNE